MYNIARLAFGIAIILSLSGCGIFRKGCKCPPVHGHKSVSVGSPSLSSFSDGNGAHLRNPSLQQHGSASFDGSPRSQHIIHQ